MIAPPSTCRHCPLISPASGEARKATALATSIARWPWAEIDPIVTIALARRSWK